MKLFPIGLTGINYEHLVKIMMQHDKNPTFQLDVNNLKLDSLDAFIFLIDSFDSKEKLSMPEFLKHSDTTLELLSLTLYHDLSMDMIDKIQRSTKLVFRNVYIPKMNYENSIFFGFVAGSLYEWRRATYTALRNKTLDEGQVRFYNQVLRIFDSLKLDKIFASFERLNHPLCQGEIYFK